MTVKRCKRNRAFSVLNKRRSWWAEICGATAEGVRRLGEGEHRDPDEGIKAWNVAVAEITGLADLSIKSRHATFPSKIKIISNVCGTTMSRTIRLLGLRQQPFLREA